MADTAAARPLRESTHIPSNKNTNTLVATDHTLSQNMRPCCSYLLLVCVTGAVSVTVAPDGANSTSASKSRHGRRGGRGRGAEEAGNVTLTSPEHGDNSEPSEGERMLATAIQLLQRLNDRMTALQAIDEQQLRRVETLEYRMTKMEVQIQEKGDGVKSELRELLRRVQQLDWLVSKLEAMLDVIKLDTTSLKQGQNQLRGFHPSVDGKMTHIIDEEFDNKMQLMTTSLYAVRGTTGVIKDDLIALKVNISKLSNMTSQLANISNQILTKQYFTNAILDLKQTPTPYAQALPQVVVRETGLPHDCWQLHQQGYNVSGVYRIQPPLSTQPFFVYCDMTSRGGGWTVVQNRFEGTVDFYRGWHDYKQGFGNIGGEFWLGLEKLHILTNYKVTELLIELEDFNLETAYAQYSAFAVGAEVEGYAITFLGSYEGDAGDSLVYHAGMKFSTQDIDNDNWHDGNCAESHTGGWWYNGCDTSNLNGRYLNGELPEQYEYQGMYWYDWHGPGYSLLKSRISVRPNKDHHPFHRIKDKKPDAKNVTENGEKEPVHEEVAEESTDEVLEQ